MSIPIASEVVGGSNFRFSEQAIIAHRFKLLKKLRSFFILISPKQKKPVLIRTGFFELK